METAHLSILASFDDLRRYEGVLTDGAAEHEFLRFAQAQEQNRLQWQTAVHEAQRLQRELDASLQNVAGLESKLFHARRLLEKSERNRRVAEASRELLVSVCGCLCVGVCANSELKPCFSPNPFDNRSRKSTRLTISSTRRTSMRPPAPSSPSSTAT